MEKKQGSLLVFNNFGENLKALRFFIRVFQNFTKNQFPYKSKNRPKNMNETEQNCISYPYHQQQKKRAFSPLGVYSSSFW